MEDVPTSAPERDARAVVNRLSRRTLMKTSAGVDIAVAVGTAGVAFAGPSSQSAADTTQTNNGNDAPDRPLIVHVIDASAGTVEVFTSSASKQIKDHDLVARIRHAARG